MTAALPPMGGSPMPARDHRRHPSHAASVEQREHAAGTPVGGAPAPAPGPRSGLPAAPPPTRALAHSVVGAAALVTVLQVVEAIVAHQAGDRFRSALARGGDVEAAFLPYDLVGGVVGVAQLATIVVTGFWLLHLRRFAERVRPTFHHNRRRWWAFGGWVIPLAFFVVPFQYVRDLRDSLDLRQIRRVAPVGAWWTFLLLNEFADRRVVTSQLNSGDAEKIADVGLFETGQLVFCVPALLLWFLVVRRLTDAADKVPAELVNSTAFVADPHPYDPGAAAPGTPLYGPPQG